MKLNMIRLLIVAFAGAFIAGCGEPTGENAPAADTAADTAQEVVEEVLNSFY